jgi:DnaA-homolog protein
LKDYNNESQIPLPIYLNAEEEQSMATFMVADSNSKAFNCLNSLLEDGVLNKGTFLYMYGETGCGKSHLLKSTYKKAIDLKLDSIILNLSEWLEFDPASLLSGIVENYDVICLDNIDSVAGNNDWESELFALFNRWLTKESGLLLVTSKFSQTLSKFSKQEFVTRLQSGITLHINTATNELMQEILVSREKMRGGILTYELAKTIVDKLKSLPVCLDALKQIDELALEHKKPLNKTMVMTVLRKRNN